MNERRQTLLSWGALIALTLVLQLATNGCGGSGESSSSEPTPTTAAEPSPVGMALPPTDNPELLSDWAQLRVLDGQLALHDGVVPYSLNSALFSDYAHKLRTVSVPDGAGPAVYDDEDVFAFPVGTVITKTFYYPIDPNEADPLRVLKAEPTPDTPAEPLDLSTVRLLETRVLVHRDDGWHALPYVWNAEQSEATLQRIGDLIPLTLVDGGAESAFTYVVPDANQCSNCHATNHSTGAIVPIGPKARHLNRDVDLGAGPMPQLALWRDVGLVGSMPALTDIAEGAVWTDDTASLDQRARAYLDVNCAHCHNRVGPADTSGLFLEPTTDLGLQMGVCKSPIAAGSGTGGRLVGIAPGRADDSIFVYRMASTDPAEMMPELGRSLVHAEGLDLISAWIDSLTGDCDLLGD